MSGEEIGMDYDSDEGSPLEEGWINLDGVKIAPAPLPALTNDVTSDRLLITGITCRDFKSYAGERILGPFHSRFNSVVGPNGSGKSNVIDALLFVFGYRAQKIRSKKVSVLIHNSDTFPNLQSTSVSVHFQQVDPEDKLVDGTEIVVTRYAFKDNTSYYKVGNEKKKFKEVAALLRKQGIDLDHNRFLILQGEVEQIALMKPKGLTENDTGMLEYLEDIIGSSRLKNPIEIFKERVSELDTERSEKLNRVKLVEKEKEELKGPMDEALEFLHLENKIVAKKNLKCQGELWKCRKKLTETEKKKEEFTENSREILKELEEITESKKEKEKILKDKNEELESISANLEETKEKFKNHELQDSKLMEDMKNTNAKRKKTMAQSKAEKEKYEKLQLVPEDNKNKIAECEVLKEKLTKQAEEEQLKYDEAMKTIKEETQSFQDEKETLETKLIDLRKVVNEKESVANIAKSELDIEESKEKRESLKLEQLELKHSKLEKDVAEKEESLKEISAQLPQIKKKTTNLKSELEKINEKVDQLENQVKSSRMNFEETRSLHQASKTRGKVHGSLMEQKNAGNIPGIFGRLGDLGAIDAKYDVAVSTAGGGSLDTIIVDNVDTAKRCIEFLRAHDVGRANFLALDKTDRWKSNCAEKFNGPENSPRLFDLIKVQDEKFKPAFYHYLRDTLVAQDMEQAQRIAFGNRRFRTITLVGELIEVSGAMSGGGKEKSRGKMGSQVVQQVNPVNLENLEKTYREKEKLLNEALNTKSEMERAQNVLEREFTDKESKERKIKMEHSRNKEEISLNVNQIKNQRTVLKSVKTDPKKLAELKEKLGELEKDAEESRESAKEVEDEIKKLNKQIKDIMGSKVKSIQKKLDDAKSQLDKVKKEITRLEVGIKSSGRDIEKSKDKYTALDAEVAEAEDKMRAMKAQRESLESISKELFDSLAKLKEQRAEKYEEYEKLKEEFEKIKTRENKHKSQKIEIEEKLTFYSDSIKEENKRIAHYNKEVKKLSYVEIPGQETEELKTYQDEELENMDLKKIDNQRILLEENLAAQKPNLAAITEYKRKEKVYLERVNELDEITEKRDKQKKNFEELRKIRLNEFMEGFAIITAKLKEMYQMITLGGDAELELVDSLDPFTEGIVFSVRPPKKSWKNISNLSGGEKTLSSLALVFALHYYKPTPLYVMDEIDAALDFKNVSIVANYIKERTKNAQFIIISLRSNMFELADRLVGIYKTYNCTKSITINPNLIQNKAADITKNVTVNESSAKRAKVN